MEFYEFLKDESNLQSNNQRSFIPKIKNNLYSLKEEDLNSIGKSIEVILNEVKVMFENKI